MSSTDHLSELESLRSQVVDLARELAERDQSMRAQSHHFEETMQDLREQSHLLHTIIEGTAAETGDEFFASLVTHLTATLHVQYAVIGEVFEGRLKKIRTLAVSAGGTLVDNFEYELTHTPCATALTQTFACFDRDVQATFPRFQHLADLGAESYCGVPIRTKGGAVIGLLAVMDTKPLQHCDYLQSLLGILAPRVVVEFERRRAEQERAQALADLHNVMETVPDVMFTLDTQGNLVKWNRRLGDVTGYSPEELLNKPALAFVPLEEQTRTAAAIQRAFTEGYAELDGQMLTKDLRTIPYHWTGALLKNHHGEPIGITGIGRDVSDKKRAEEELTQQRRHLIDAQALAHLGSWDWDIDTGEVRWSDEQFRIFGHEPGTIAVTYDTFLASLHPEDHDSVLAAINDALLGKRVYDVEYRIVRPNGEVRFIHTRGDVYRDATGHPLSMAGTALDITERKRIEDALRASEERWHLAVRGSNDGIWDWNIQTGDVFFSSRWKAMRGFDDHEIKNDVNEWRSRIHPDDLGRVLQSIDAYLAKHAQEFCEEYRVQRKDGSYMWILDRGMALWADDGTLLRMAGSESDITERKRTEEALRVSEERFALAVAGSTDILWDGHPLPDKPWYAPQTPIWWSPRVRELLGLEESESFETLEQWAARLHPEDKARVFGQLTAHIEHRVPYDAEYRLRNNRGDYRWIRGRGQAMWDEQGEIRRMSGSCQDITDRKWAEEAIREAELRYRTIFEQAGAGVAQIDSHTGRFVQVNRRYCEIVGLTEAEMLATTVGVITHPDDLQSDLENMTRLLRGEIRSFTMEKRYIRPDGGIVWVNLNVAPLWGPGEQAIHHIAIVEDITERKRTEEALRKSEERYARATAVGKVGVWELDVVTDTYHGDPNLKALFGYVGDELSTDLYVWLNLVHPDDQAIALEHWQRIVNGERDNYNYELRMLKKDGTVIWVDIRGHAVRDHEGQVAHLFGATVDISERKQVQDALAQSERQLRTVLDSLPVGVWFTDQLGKPLLANPAAKQIWSNIKQIGLRTPNNPSDWWKTIEPANEPHRRALSHALTTGAPSLNETLDLECLDGTKKTIRNSSVQIKDEAGNILGAIVLNEDITTLRKAQEALQLTQFSVDRAVEGFFWITPEARILYVNEAACRMLEYTRDELTAMTLHDIDPNFPPEVWPTHWDQLKQKGSMTFESKHRSRIGRVLETEVTVNYLQYEGKEYNCAIIRDIGERKRADAALRASEERYRELYDDTPTMYFTLATDGTVRSVNRFGAEQLGYRVEELIGHSVLGVFHEHDKETVAACLSECLATPETTRHWEFRKVRKDGSIIWVQETARVGQSSTGETVVLVTCEDITERKRAEEALRTSEERYRSLVDNAPIGIFVNKAGQFVYANREIQRILNATCAEQLLGTPVLDRIAPEFHQVVKDRIHALMDNRQPVPSLDEQYVRLDGSRVDVAVTAIPTSFDGTPVMQVLVLDIAERKHMEEALRQRERDLRAAIEERERISQDLHDGILQSLFAIGLSLETTKLMMSARTRKMSGPPLDQAIVQLNRVMHEIRNFIAGLGSDLLHGKDLPMALNHMLASLTENQATRVRLAVDDRAAQAVSAEQSLHLLLVIQEAVSNCIRHGHALEATVSLKMLKQGVRLSVRDNGRGFNPKVAKGTGHGLRNMAVRAQKIGARFTVMSKVNEGTRIVLDLPKEASDVLR
jgi:PAS domain S-box-containing protein